MWQPSHFSRKGRCSATCVNCFWEGFGFQRAWQRNFPGIQNLKQTFAWPQGATGIRCLEAPRAFQPCCRILHPLEEEGMGGPFKSRSVHFRLGGFFFHRFALQGFGHGFYGEATKLYDVKGALPDTGAGRRKLHGSMGSVSSSTLGKSGGHICQLLR